MSVSEKQSSNRKIDSLERCKSECVEEGSLRVKEVKDRELIKIESSALKKVKKTLSHALKMWSI